MPVFSRVWRPCAPPRSGDHLDFETAATVILPATGAAPGRMLLDHPAAYQGPSAAVKGSANHRRPSRRHDRHPRPHPVVHLAGYSLPWTTPVTVDAFPDPPPTTAPTHVVDREALSALVERVTVAADRGDTLPILTGINTVLDKGSMTLTATDRYRPFGTIPVNGTTTEKVLIPAPVPAKLLPRLTSAGVRLGVDVIAGVTWLTLADDSTTGRIRTLDGDYPRVSRSWEQAPTRTVTLDRAQLSRRATRAASLSAAVKAAKNNPVTITVGPTALTIAPATDGDRAKVTAPALPADIAGQTEAWTTGANAAFLPDAIATLTADKVTST